MSVIARSPNVAIMYGVNALMALVGQRNVVSYFRGKSLAGVLMNTQCFGHLFSRMRVFFCNES